MRKKRLGPELTRLVLIAGAAIVLLAAGMGMFVRYHEVRQTELAGYATAKAVAEQVSVQRSIYAEHIVPRAQRAGMNIDVDFEARENTLPVPVTLVALVGAEFSRQFPASRVRLYSRYPFTLRGSPQIDAFEGEALVALERSPKTPFYRLERIDGKKVIRYAVADVMTQECVDCHNQHPLSPRKDWKVGDVRGAVEVTLPMEDLAARIHSEQLSAGLLLFGGVFSFVAAVALFIRQDVRRIRQEQLALTDPTTGLYVRRGALPLIEREIARARRHHHSISFILFDIDRFKQVNDRHGHAAGDQVLAGVGQVLADAVRKFDVAARWGGEEFLVVLPQAGAEAARVIAERLRESVRRAETGVASVTLSAGVSELTADDTLESALARADAKLYEAKEAGRNTVR